MKKRKLENKLFVQLIKWVLKRGWKLLNFWKQIWIYLECSTETRRKAREFFKKYVCIPWLLLFHMLLALILERISVFSLWQWYRCHSADRHPVMLNLVLRKGVPRQTITAAEVGLPCSYTTSTMSTSQSTCSHLQSNLIKHKHVFLPAKSKQSMYNGYIVNFNKKLQTVKDEIPTARLSHWCMYTEFWIQCVV